jgi:hypothetical protein
MNLFVESHPKLLILSVSRLQTSFSQLLLLPTRRLTAPCPLAIPAVPTPNLPSSNFRLAPCLPKPLAQASSIPACVFTPNRLRACLHTRLFYSYLNESDGLAVAALNACKPTIANANAIKNTDGSTYVRTPGVMWYSKLASHAPTA